MSLASQINVFSISDITVALQLVRAKQINNVLSFNCSTYRRGYILFKSGTTSHIDAVVNRLIYIEYSRAFRL